MYQLSLVFFALAALLGMHSLVRILNNQRMSKIVNSVHGVCATIALMLLILYAVENNRTDLSMVVILFIAMAMAGFVLVYRDSRGRSTPKRIILFQGVLATSAFLTLVLQI